MAAEHLISEWTIEQLNEHVQAKLDHDKLTKDCKANCGALGVLSQEVSGNKEMFIELRDTIKQHGLLMIGQLCAAILALIGIVVTLMIALQK